MASVGRPWLGRQVFGGNGVLLCSGGKHAAIVPSAPPHPTLPPGMAPCCLPASWQTSCWVAREIAYVLMPTELWTPDSCQQVLAANVCGCDFVHCLAAALSASQWFDHTPVVHGTCYLVRSCMRGQGGWTVCRCRYCCTFRKCGDPSPAALYGCLMIVWRSFAAALLHCHKERGGSQPLVQGQRGVGNNVRVSPHRRRLLPNECTSPTTVVSYAHGAVALQVMQRVLSQLGAVVR